MMQRVRFLPVCLSAAIPLTAFAAAPHERERVPLEASTLIIEFNSSAEDLGVQFFLDSEGWTSVDIFNPKGEEVFSAEAKGRLALQGGGTELFLESVEPELASLSFEKFFQRFPDGTYQFRAETADGGTELGKAEFTHSIPAGPEIVSPATQGGACAKDVAIPAVIAWNPVTTSIFGEPIDIKGYEVIVESEDVNFDVHIPAAAGTSLTISPEMLQPGTDYIFEVLAIEQGGNQTITEGCFSTAP